MTSALLLGNTSDSLRSLLGLGSICVDSADDEDADNAAFEVSLNTFGTAAGANYSIAGSGQYTRWKKVGDNDNGDYVVLRRERGYECLCWGWILFGSASVRECVSSTPFTSAEDSIGPTTT